MTDEFKQTSTGQQLPKDRIIIKTVEQDLRFTYQDIHTMIAEHKKALADLDKQEARIHADRKEQQDILAKWEEELAVVEANFPELKEAEEGIISPIQKADIGSDDDAEGELQA